MKTDRSSEQKRLWRPWYSLPNRPLCPDCNVPCIVKRTRTAPDGRRIQHRYCPSCGRPNKTIYDPDTNKNQGVSVR